MYWNMLQERMRMDQQRQLLSPFLLAPARCAALRIVFAAGAAAVQSAYQLLQRKQQEQSGGNGEEAACGMYSRVAGRCRMNF